VHTLDQIVAESPIFAGLEPAQLELIAGCARNTGFARGERLFREGDPADTFYLVRRGRVALTIHAGARGELTVETIERGDVVGWSWLFEPYRWHFDAVAVEEVRAVAFDGACLRGKCADDNALGYELMRRFAAVMIDRLQHTRMRLIDVYGSYPRN
jgi:CRP-like cAMP-binding protein